MRPLGTPNDDGAHVYVGLVTLSVSFHHEGNPRGHGSSLVFVTPEEARSLAKALLFGAETCEKFASPTITAEPVAVTS